MELTAPATSPQTPGVITVDPDGGDSDASKTGTEGVLSSDFETFLVMLTAQIQNQDPLNPMDSSDYAVQLATFSGVEQQVQTNELLRALDKGGFDGIAEYAGWVGMEAKVSSQAYYGGAPVELHVEPPAGARDMKVTVTTLAGKAVWDAPVSASDVLQNDTITWDGKNSEGVTLEPGLYKVSLSGIDSNGELITVPVSSYSKITEVRAGTDAPEILTEGGRAMSPAEITALRSADSV